MSKNTGHTAISSWSGYIYQGKIAIYHVLKLFLSNKDLSNFSLRLDCEEDFDILNGQQVVSLHQVKGKGSDLFSGYQSAFTDIKGKSGDYPDAKLYFHLAKNLRDKTVTNIETDYRPVRVYLYSQDKYHSTLAEVDILIQGVIKDYFVIKKSEEHKQQDNYLIQVREKLDELVLKKILYIHHENMIGNGMIYDLALNNPISFNEFQDVLDSDNLAEWMISEAYFTHLFQKEINTFYQEYLFELDEEELDVDIKNRLNRYLIHIGSLNSEEILKFVRSMFPHRTFKLNSILDYGRVAPKEEELKDAFFLILKDITQEANVNKSNIYWQCKLKNIYVPSAIDSSNSTRVSKQIVNNITQSDIETAFEEQNIITTHLDVPSVLLESNIITNVDKLNNANRITRWANTSLVPIEKAKKKLNND